jgi:hypothetical protein
MVRVWEPGGSASPEGIRGTVVHLPSGSELTFTDASSLIAFLAGGGARNASPPGRTTDQLHAG